MKRGRAVGRAGFHVGIRNRRAQVASMVLVPGASEGGKGNSHRGADQWLYVIEGSGSATVAGRQVALRPGTVLLVERGETHAILNTGRRLLKTLNVYVPPAYTPAGEELPRGRHKRKR